MRLTNKQVLAIVALALQDVKANSWSYEITYLDVVGGALETGYYRMPNIAAMQLRSR